MYKISSLILLAFTLSACNTDNIDTVEFPVESVMLNEIKNPSDTEVHKEIDGYGVLTVQTITTPLPDTEFEGIKAQSYKYINIMKNGEDEIERDETIAYYSSSPFKTLGSTSSTSYEVSSKNAEIPKTAKIGESGIYSESTQWLDSSKETKSSENRESWNLKKASSDTAWLCVNIESKDVDKAEFSDLGGGCYEIDSEGAILSQKLIVKGIAGDENNSIKFTSKKD